MAAHTSPTSPPLGGAWPAGDVVVAGAHGGAGTSTLAFWLRPAWDAGVVRRPRRDGTPFATGGLPLVLVARSTVACAGAATHAVNALIWQGARVDVLAVVSDGLPEPIDASYRFRVLGGRVPVVVRVPFVPALRAAASPASVRLPRRARRALEDIHVAARSRADVREFTPA